MVKILLGHGDVDPNKSDNGGKTPLGCAAQNGHAGVVKILLGRVNIEPEKPDHASQTPLWNAAASGHEEVVVLLLGRVDVDPNTPDITVKRYSCALLSMGIQEWRKYCVGGTASTPTYKIAKAEHHSVMLLEICT